MNPPLIFNKAAVSPGAIQRAARRYVGMDYSRFHSRVVEDAAGNLSGSVDCFRLFLFIFRDLGYLPTDFDPMAVRPQPKEETETIIRSILRSNMQQVQKKCRTCRGERVLLQVGDLLWLKVGNNNAENHFAMVTDRAPLPYGRILHAESEGKVIEQGLMPHNWNRIESAWRLRGVVG